MGIIADTANRELTHWFIEQDPTTVTLIPQTKVKTAGGAFNLVPGVARAPQIVKLIFPSGSSDGISSGQDGRVRKYDFILVGEWDAVVEIDDYFEDSQGNFWIITGLVPYNGYEVKATMISYGGHPTNG